MTEFKVGERVRTSDVEVPELDDEAAMVVDAPEDWEGISGLVWVRFDDRPEDLGPWPYTPDELTHAFDPTKPKVYLAGPMSGIEDYNFPSFNRAAKWLRGQGYEVFNPAESFDGDQTLPREDYFRLDYAELLECDALYALPGWSTSKGAVSEVLMALNLDLDIRLIQTRNSPDGEPFDTVSLPEEVILLSTDLYASGESHPYSKPRDEEDIVVLDDDDTVEIDTGDGEDCDYTSEDCKIRITLGKPEGEEVRVTSSTGGQKGQKPARHDLIPPKVLDTLARVYGFGASKYADNNWRKGYEWSLNYAALQRHLGAFWSGEDLDPESGLPHLGHAMWHVAALLTFSDPDNADKYGEFDTRYKG